MKYRVRATRLALWAAAVVAGLAASLSGTQTKPSSAGARVVDDGLVIEDVTIISPERPLPMPHSAVVIRGGRIVEIGNDIVAGPHAKRIDGRGRFLIPGLIDSHVHLRFMDPFDDARVAHPELLQAYRSQLPRAYLAFGFTTLVDLDLREQTLSWFNAAAVHPRVYHCGQGVRTMGGYGALAIPKDVAAAKAGANFVYDTAQEKDWPAILDRRDYTPARAVDRVMEAGGICVKVFVEPGFGGVFHWPVFRAETLEALRTETRRRGLVLVIHANGVDSWRAALDAHADVIAHGLWHWTGDRLSTTPPTEAREVIQAAGDAGVWVQPTLQVVYGENSIFDPALLNDSRLAEALPGVLIRYLKSNEAQASRRETADEYKQMFAKIFAPSVDAATAMSIAPARATATLRLMLGQKVKLLFGSDTPSNGALGNPPGLNGRLEMERWAEAGVSLARILRAATLDNAAAFGLSADIGSIEVGKRADLLLLRADPLQAITAYDAIDTIFLNGDPIERGSLLPAN